MEFGIEKFAMLVMKSSKLHRTEGVELPNQVVIRTFAEKDTYKYLGILEADTIKQVEMKEKIKKEYLRRIQNINRKGHRHADNASMDSYQLAIDHMKIRPNR